MLFLGRHGIFRNEDGLAAVEFALLAPVLILMIVGMIDFGMFINQKMQAENLARAAAEYVVKGGSEENIMTDVIAASGVTEEDMELIETESQTTCECSDGEEATCGSQCGGDGYQRMFYSFSLTRTYAPMFPYPGIPDQMQATGSARMQIQ